MKKIFVLSIFALILLSTAVLADADINDDGVIDLSDLVLVTADFGKTTGYDPEADTNNDGIVDIYDVVYVASRIGTTITCTDGTLYSQCSVTKPMYCNNGTLILRCSTCGCPTGQTCQANESCITPPPPSCSGTCKTNTCSSYSSCSSASGTCTTGYCCTGTCTTPGGNEVYATSLSPTDIQAAVNRASPGDTVVLPAGDYSGFNTAIYVRNGISMRGQGKAATIMRKTSTSSSAMFVWNEAGESSAYVTEIKDFTLYGMGAQHVLDQGINLWNGMQNFNVHDIDFHATGHSGVWAFGFGSKGVIWNCNFYDIYAAGNGYSVRIDARADGDTWFGDSSWAAPVNWGSDEFVFIEDCLFDNGRSSIDGHEGGRYVARHNIFQNGWTNLDYVADHGRAPCTNSNRGMRAMEIYQNTFYHSSNYTNGIDVMGGDWLIWDNDFNAWPTAPAGYCIYYDVADCDRCPSYPASDQSRDSYVWNNRRNGITFTSWNSPELINGCETLIQEGRDIHFNVPASYTPYTYPHPLRSS